MFMIEYWLVAERHPNDFSLISGLLDVTRLELLRPAGPHD
jgi:hypothetical protein